MGGIGLVQESENCGLQVESDLSACFCKHNFPGRPPSLFAAETALVTEVSTHDMPYGFKT